MPTAAGTCVTFCPYLTSPLGQPTLQRCFQVRKMSHSSRRVLLHLLFRSKPGETNLTEPGDEGGHRNLQGMMARQETEHRNLLGYGKIHLGVLRRKLLQLPVWGRKQGNNHLLYNASIFMYNISVSPDIDTLIRFFPFFKRQN